MIKVPIVFLKYLNDGNERLRQFWFYLLINYADKVIETDETDWLNEISEISKEDISEFYENGRRLLLSKKRVYPKIDSEKKVVAENILEFLNVEVDVKYQKTAKNLNLIIGLLNRGYSPYDIKKVILKKKKDWQNTDYEKFLRPETLFNPNKFESYYNQKENILNNNLKKFANAINEAKQLFGINKQ